MFYNAKPEFPIEIHPIDLHKKCTSRGLLVVDYLWPYIQKGNQDKGYNEHYQYKMGMVDTNLHLHC